MLTHSHTRAHIYTHSLTHALTHKFTYMLTHTHTLTYSLTYIHTHIHSLTHALTHTQPNEIIHFVLGVRSYSPVNDIPYAQNLKETRLTPQKSGHWNANMCLPLYVYAFAAKGIS